MSASLFNSTEMVSCRVLFRYLRHHVNKSHTTFDHFLNERLSRDDPLDQDDYLTLKSQSAVPERGSGALAKKRMVGEAKR
jgi:hypothetical protein